jgi:hypothetical protein
MIGAWVASDTTAQLELKPDSTFILERNGSDISGTWGLDSGHVFLVYGVGDVKRRTQASRKLTTIVVGDGERSVTYLQATPDLLLARSVAKRDWRREEAMKNALRRLAVAQEAYYSDNGSYAREVDRLRYSGPDSVVLSLTAASREAWSGRAIHDGGTRWCEASYNRFSSTQPVVDCARR